MNINSDFFSFWNHINLKVWDKVLTPFYFARKSFVHVSWIACVPVHPYELWFDFIYQWTRNGVIFCVEFQELSLLTHDLSQSEKKINIVTSWVNTQKFSKWSKLSFWVKIVVILCICSACTNSYFLLSLG